MSYGYSLQLLESNKRADRRNLGVALGRVCIRKCIPVSVVAGELGVSAQTVYNWFSGVTNPQARLAPQVQALLLNLRK
jgi:hypothetical protein